MPGRLNRHFPKKGYWNDEGNQNIFFFYGRIAYANPKIVSLLCCCCCCYCCCCQAGPAVDPAVFRPAFRSLQTGRVAISRRLNSCCVFHDQREPWIGQKGKYLTTMITKNKQEHDLFIRAQQSSSFPSQTALARHLGTVQSECSMETRAAVETDVSISFISSSSLSKYIFNSSTPVH